MSDFPLPALLTTNLSPTVRCVIERGARAFGGIVVDTREWPILVMDFPEKRVSDTAARDSLEYIGALMKQVPHGEKFFQLTDLSRMKEVAPASQRKYAADWAASTDAVAHRCRVGGAVVATSAMVRGVLTAVFWLSKPSQPTTVVATRDEGLRLGVAALENVLSPLPQNLVAMKSRLAPAMALGRRRGM